MQLPEAREAVGAERRQTGQDSGKPRSANTWWPTTSRRSARWRRWASSRFTRGTQRMTMSIARSHRLGSEPRPGRRLEAGRNSRTAHSGRPADARAHNVGKDPGGRGLHVVAPIKPSRHWSECLEFARAVSEAIERTGPLYTTAFAKAGREQKILIDYLRNNRTNTSVCAFSPRATGRGCLDAARLEGTQCRSLERPPSAIWSLLHLSRHHPRPRSPAGGASRTPPLRSAPAKQRLSRPRKWLRPTPPPTRYSRRLRPCLS
jgi:hypothetical protein